MAAVEAEFAVNPPTLCVIGLSGVGKSSTVNALFGTRRHVSATIRGTNRFDAATFDMTSTRAEGVAVKCALKVFDAPGLGEDVDLDENYLQRYAKHLPKCDVALWVVAARNRALALDQQYLKRLAPHLPNLVVGINQVDLVDPLTWSEAINLPSRPQESAIAEIVADRSEKIGRFMSTKPPVVAYSALRYYNLQALYLACINAAPAPRKWMFELLKSFSTHDWLDRAKGLTDKQKMQLAQAHITADAKLTLHRVRR